MKSIQSKLKSIQSKLKSIESKLKSIESKLKSIEVKLKSIQSNLKSIENELKSIESKLKSIEIYHFFKFHTIAYPIPGFFHTVLYPKFVRGGPVLICNLHYSHIARTIAIGGWKDVLIRGLVSRHGCIGTRTVRKTQFANSGNIEGVSTENTNRRTVISCTFQCFQRLY